MRGYVCVHVPVRVCACVHTPRPTRQVHVAKLKDGRKVVVKVQHARVRELMLEDLWSLWVIVRFVAWAEPEYDFRSLSKAGLDRTPASL